MDTITKNNVFFYKTLVKYSFLNKGIHADVMQDCVIVGFYKFKNLTFAVEVIFHDDKKESVILHLLPIETEPNENNIRHSIATGHPTNILCKNIFDASSYILKYAANYQVPRNKFI